MQKGNRTLTRAEKQDSSGVVTGYYNIKDPGGIFRLVSYEANVDTFQAQVLTNRPGEANTSFPETSEHPGNTNAVSPTVTPTAVPSGLLAEDLVVSTTTIIPMETTTMIPVETTTKDFVTLEPTVFVDISETTTVSSGMTTTMTMTTDVPTTTSLPIETREEVPPPTTTHPPPPAPLNPDSVVIVTPIPTIVIDSPQYWLEYEILLNGGRLYRSEGTNEEGKIIGSYMILLDTNKNNSSSDAPVTGQQDVTRISNRLSSPSRKRRKPETEWCKECKRVDKMMSDSWKEEVKDRDRKGKSMLWIKPETNQRSISPSSISRNNTSNTHQ